MKQFVILALSAILLTGCGGAGEGAKIDSASLTEQKLDWFQDSRYGMFIHWAPSVVYGGQFDWTDISWCRQGNPPDPWCGGGPVPADLYDNAYRIFNPTEFDADKWVEFAKACGMKYIVITTRHHDSFSMFDTAQSDFKITNDDCAYKVWLNNNNPGLSREQINRKADIIRAVADAAHRGGIGLGLYYSEPDWLQEDYRIGLTGKNSAGEEVGKQAQDEARRRYQEFMHEQLAELTTLYGKVDILWFDAIKPHHVEENGWGSLWITRETFDMIKRNQPGIIINDRHGFEPDYQTSENFDGKYIAGVAQESCQTVGKQWSWMPEEIDEIPAPDWVLDRIIINASRNTNMLMNIAPSPQGTFNTNQSELLLGIGRWLAEHRDAFYGTRGGPVVNNADNPQFVTMYRGDKIYVHILAPELAGKDISLPGVEIKNAYAWSRPGDALSFENTDTGAVLTVPEDINALDEVVVLRAVFDPAEIQMI
ncbi:MAG: alpha-L-fucosidase [Phycisphaerae bacterium]